MWCQVASDILNSGRQPFSHGCHLVGTLILRIHMLDITHLILSHSAPCNSLVILATRHVLAIILFELWHHTRRLLLGLCYKYKSFSFSTDADNSKSSHAQAVLHKHPKFNFNISKPMVNVMLCSDSNDLPGLIAAVNSIRVNTKAYVRFYLVVDQISENHVR